MKIERLIEGSSECPLVRLFDFTLREAKLLRLCVHELADSTQDRVDLVERLGATPIDNFALSLVTGQQDLGLVPEDSHFAWMLRSSGWAEVENLIEPFTRDTSAYQFRHYQWLSEIGDNSLLLSPSGYW